MISIKKLRKMALLALSNGLRLHYDSVALYEQERYPSAYQLSVLAQEELGKMYMISNYIWSTSDSGPFDAKLTEEWVKRLNSHTVKQYAFHRHSPIIDEFFKDRKLIESIGSGAFDSYKQKATYVSLKRLSGKVDLKGKIEHPFQISKNATKEQITKVNDHLLVTGIGIRFGQFDLNDEDINSALKNKRFLTQNFENWRFMSPQAAKRIGEIQSFFKEQLLKLSKK